MHNTKEFNLCFKITWCESNLHYLAGCRDEDMKGGREAIERCMKSNTEAIAKAIEELAALGFDKHGSPLQRGVKLIRRVRGPAV